MAGVFYLSIRKSFRHSEVNKHYILYMRYKMAEEISQDEKFRINDCQVAAESIRTWIQVPSPATAGCNGIVSSLVILFRSTPWKRSAGCV